MATDDLIDLDITGVAHGGVFVGRHDGRVVFVPDAIPGERVRVRLTDPAGAENRRFWRGETIEVVDAAPQRRPHVWRQADIDTAPEHRPGGADFGHIDLDHQRELKRTVVIDAVQRIGRLDVPVTMRPASVAAETDGETADGTRWRTRVSLHVDDEGRVGPFAARSHRVIPVDDLPLATAAVEAVARGLQGGKRGRMDLVQPADGRVRVIPRPAEHRPAEHRPAEDRPTEHRPHPPRERRPKPRGPIPGREVITERVGDREFRLDAGGFWQVHRLAAHTLTQLVAGKLADDVDPDASHLDLYGGVGLFAATLAQLGGTHVTSVESDARATAHAGANLADWAGARAATGRVDRWLQTLRAEASTREKQRLTRGVVLLDPPRSGAGRDVVASVVDLAPATVVYVACDPVALARDLATFRESGYETEQVDALDLFPNSHHVEAVAVLSPRS